MGVPVNGINAVDFERLELGNKAGESELAGCHKLEPEQLFIPAELLHISYDLLSLLDVRLDAQLLSHKVSL